MRGALDPGDDRSVAVAGTGLRHCYPAANRASQDEIARRGAVISQFWPDAGPAKQHFPHARRRDERVRSRNGHRGGRRAPRHPHPGTAGPGARQALEHGRHVLLLPEVVAGTTWGREIAERPNTTVLEARTTCSRWSTTSPPRRRN
ncbi:DNA-processing protein DprA [Actinosynnema sp. CA-248983]